jgi:hypothetical protein
MDLLVPLLLFGGAGAVTGLVVGVFTGARRYRSMLAVGCVAAVLAFAIFGLLSSGDDKWWWTVSFLFANVLAYAVFLDLGAGTRAVLARVRAA